MLRTIVVAALFLLTASSCSPRGVSASIDSSQPSETLQVRRADFQDRLLLTGALEAVEADKIIVPRTPAWQLQVRWLEDDGAEVELGQKIVEFDNTQFASELEQRRLAETRAYNDWLGKQAEVASEIDEARFRLDERRIALEKARIEAGVPEELRPAREHQEKQLALARAESEYDKATETLRTAERAATAALEERKIALRRASEEIATTEAAIEALTLQSPREGLFVVSENRNEGRKAQVGDTVWPGFTLAQIPDLTEMQIAAHLSDVDDGRLEVGMRAISTLDTYPDIEFEGRVVEIAPVAQEQTHDSLRRSFKVIVLLDRSDPELMRPGMSVRVEVLPPPLEDVLVVPRVALDFAADVPALLTDGGPVEVSVTRCNPLDCVVEGDVREGTRLGVSG